MDLCDRRIGLGLCVMVDNSFGNSWFGLGVLDLDDCEVS